MLAGIQRAVMVAAALAGVAGEAAGALSFNVAAGGWPNDAHRTAAVNAMGMPSSPCCVNVQHFPRGCDGHECAVRRDSGATIRI